MYPLRDKEILDSKQMASIFSNLEALLPVNEAVFKVLPGVFVKSWDTVGQSSFIF